MGGKPIYHPPPRFAADGYLYNYLGNAGSSGFIVAESVLSLIGLGIQQPSWGNMLSQQNASILVLQPWLIWPPALLIILTVLAFNLQAMVYEMSLIRGLRR